MSDVKRNLEITVQRWLNSQGEDDFRPFEEAYQADDGADEENLEEYILDERDRTERKLRTHSDETDEGYGTSRVADIVDAASDVFSVSDDEESVVAGNLFCVLPQPFVLDQTRR